jgi:hypothetical protein
MFEHGDILVSTQGLKYRFRRYANNFDDNHHDCEVYESERAFLARSDFGILHRQSIKFWFFDKRFVLTEKTRRIKNNFNETRKNNYSFYI